MKKLLCVLIVFVVFGCHQSMSSEQLAMDDRVDLNMPSPVEETAVMEKTIERKLIQNGSISFEVTDVCKARSQIILLTNDTGGYIASEEHHSNSGELIGYEQVVRIPGNKLDEFTLKVESLATTINDRSFSAEDVTQEFVDLESRLVAKKELEARFRQIVKQAKTVKDILEVEGEIGTVREEIEEIQGRLKYLSNKVSYSTITLSYYQPTIVQTPGIGNKFAEAFLGGWDSLVALAVGLTRAWPYLIIIGSGLWLLIRRWRKEDKHVIQPQ